LSILSDEAKAFVSKKRNNMDLFLSDDSWCYFRNKQTSAIRLVSAPSIHLTALLEAGPRGNGRYAPHPHNIINRDSTLQTQQLIHTTSVIILSAWRRPLGWTSEELRFESHQGQNFSLLHSLQTGFGAHLSTHAIGNGGSLLGSKAAGDDHSPPINAKVKNRWSYTPT
jgi:hypothetical protein